MNLNEFRDLMGETNPLLKSHIFGDEFYEKSSDIGDRIDGNLLRCYKSFGHLFHLFVFYALLIFVNGLTWVSLTCASTMKLKNLCCLGFK